MDLLYRRRLHVVLNDIARVAVDDGRSIPTGRDPELAQKRSRKVALIGEADLHRGGGYGLPGCEKPARKRDAALHEIGMRRRPDLTRKASQKLKAADAGELSEICQRDGELGCRIEPLERL